MYGVPADLDLTPFEGAALERIGLGMYIIDLQFSGDIGAIISIEGDWELRAPDGSVLDHQTEPQNREAYRLHVLLGGTVTATGVSAPESFLLRFESGHELHVFDRSPMYESFSIQPGDIYV